MTKFCIFLFFLFLIGCKSRPVHNYAIPKGSSKELILKKHSINTINAKSIFFKRSIFSIESKDLTQSLSGSYFIQKDSFIIFSIQALLGIEVARIKVSPQEVIILDRFKKQALYVNYELFVSKYTKGISFKTLQAILLNSVFELSNASSGEIDADAYVVDYADSLFIVKNPSVGMFSWLTSSKSNTFDQSFVFEVTSGNLVQSNVIDNSLNSTLKIDYSLFNEEDQITLPLGYDILATIRENSYKFSIHSSSFIINSVSGITFTIPSSYDKIYK